MAAMGKIRKRIEDACRAAKDEGWKIAPGSFRMVDVRRCCPVGALVVDVKSMTNYTSVAVSRLGVTDAWIMSFASGFDGSNDSDGVADAYDLGREFRRQYDRGEL